MMQLNTAEAAVQLEICMKAGLPAFFKGSPGIGKSAIVHQVAKDYNLELIDVRLAQCDPTDLLGFPHIDVKTNRGSYVPMDMFPIVGDPLPKGRDGWFLFLDEMNSADRGVQKAAYKLLLDRMMGNAHLHERVVMAAAGNLDTDGAIVEELSTALQTRLIHFELYSCVETWLAWACGAGQLDHRVTDFIKFNNKLLNTFDPDKETPEPTYACERTWDFASRICKVSDPNLPVTRASLCGTLSEGVAAEFIAYIKVYKGLPTILQILADPLGISIPDSKGTLFALTGTLANNADTQTIDPLMDFISRLPLEFQIVTMRELNKRNNRLLQSPAVRKWLAVNNTEIF